VPVLTTLIVLLAAAAMVALGLWQLLDRLPQKQAYLAKLAANPARPAVPFPRAGDDRLLFRRSAGSCAAPVRVTLAGAGAAGFRAIATCAAGGPTPSMIVQLGTTRDPMARPAWAGGPVTGYISDAPDHRPLLALAFDRAATPLMLVADRPLPGLQPNRPPDLDAVPNNHLAYAVQWFIFAGVALVIYALALRRRLR
jgi:surfeit locus 1 family protein